MIYRTHGTPTERDPIGGEGAGDPTDLPVSRGRSRPDGTWDIEVDSFGTRTVLEGVPEGDASGMVREESGLRRSEARGLLQRMVALRQSGPTAVQLTIDAGRVARGELRPRETANALLALAEDSGRPALERAFAAHLLMEMLGRDAR